MPLETASTITDLVPSNPAGSDQLSSSDDHIRLIKGALKGSFPNFTSAPVVSTNAQIDAAAAAVASGVSVINDNGIFFKTNTGVGLTSTVAGEMEMVLGGAVAATYSSVSGNKMHWMGTASFDGAISGPGVVPVGGMVMWLTDTLPTDGTWCWANGGTLSRTGNGAALFALTGTAFGVGDGSTTFNVINMQEATPVGKSTMGGAASPGLLTSISSTLSAVLGSLFGSDTHTLTTTELPTFTPAGTITNGAIHITNTGAPYGGSSAAVVPSSPGGPAFIYGLSSISFSATQDASTFTGTPIGGGAAHAITQPSRAVNFIIRIG